MLENRADITGSLLCVGLDPHPEDLRPPGAAAALEFCLRLVEATHPYAVAFKPNAAFFEIYGASGAEALQRLIAAIPADIPVILDAKRGDIPSTAQAYARAAFDVMGAHAVTVHPWMGHDAVEPFLNDPARGAFLLCRTSNPGSREFMGLPLLAGGDLSEELARQAERWNSRGNVGLVVGATHPDVLRRIRQVAPSLWILAPGVGAQGAELQEALGAGLRADGKGLLISSSRALSRSEDPGEAARLMVEEIRTARRRPTVTPPARPWEVADGLLESGCVRLGSFILKSGKLSPIYLDLRRLIGSPRLLALVADAYAEVLRGLPFDHLAALPYAALPIGTAVSLRGGWPLIYPRKEVKSYGTSASVEGVFSPGERCVLIDDLATTGGSKLEAAQKLRGEGLVAEDVVVLIDRGSGARAMLAEAGLRLHAVFTLTELLDRWLSQGRIDPEKVRQVHDFLAQG